MKYKKTKEYQAFKNTVKKIRSFFQKERLAPFFSKEIEEELKRCYQTMEENLENYWKTNQPPPISEEQINLVKKTLQVFLYIINERAIDHLLQEFIGSFVLFIYNWNNMLVKNGQIDQTVKTIDRLLRAHLTFVEAIEIFKRLLEKLKTVLEYSPPSFQLAKHYLDLLEGKFSREKQKKSLKTQRKRKK